MTEHPLYKPLMKALLILAVLGLCGLVLFPPSQRLRPGLDLAGGTTLVYQVDVPEDQDARQVIDQTIAVLRKRVDPDGIMNLIWRRQGGNRIEIQMPPPAPETKQRRERYMQLRQALIDANIDQRQLDSVLRADADQRGPALDRLAGDDPQRRGLIQALVSAHDALTIANTPYDEAQKRVRQIRGQLDSLDIVATTELRRPLEEDLKAAQTDLIAKTRLFLAARNHYDAARAAVLATNIDPVELEHAAALPEKPATGAQPGTTQRQQALEQLVARHPGREGQVRATAEAFTLYNEIKRGIDDPNDLIALLRGSGVLEFRVCPPADLPGVQEYRDLLDERGPNAGASKPFRWFMVDDVSSFAEEPAQRRALEADPTGYFSTRDMVGQMHGQDIFLLLSNTSDGSITRKQDGWKLTQARKGADRNGYPAVDFWLNRTGGQLMGALTEKYKGNPGRPMAIVLDGRIISAPNINGRINDQGNISGGRGGFSPQEMQYLLRTLNAGSLHGRLSQQPIYVKKFGPQLGQDNLNRGLKASVWALIAVAILMCLYYLFCGLVADFALAANMVVILGIMAMFGATFTLPGIAGIVLTIGMAVDANVLIFERIREELDRKADLVTAIRLGYEKALSTIIDANVTTLITCFVLYKTATAEVKGFAVTLMTGIVATMFTALFCTRVVMEIYLLVVKPKSLNMLPTLVPSVRRLLSPNINWVGKRHVFFVVSAVLMVSGGFVVMSRGVDLLDIEFRSGTQVSFNLADDQTLSLDDVRRRLTAASQQFGLADLAGDRATVVTAGSAQADRAGAFSVATLETDADAVSKAITAQFADVLDTQRAVAFKAMGPGPDAPAVDDAPVFIISQANLGNNIHRSGVHADVTDYLGGVAMVLDEMSPPVMIQQLEDRIQRRRMQPTYEAQGYRPFAVIGLELASQQGSDDGEAPGYRSVAVVVSDPNINYLDAPASFSDAGGLADTEWRLVYEALRTESSLDSVSNFSSQVSRTMKDQAIVALVLSLLAIVAYIWFRFGSLRFGLAAIMALVHDVTIALGVVGLAGLISDTALGQFLLLDDFKINLALVAAALTIVGYSLNDTIIVFDRIRENRGRLATVTPGIINDSINQTVSRTVMTSGTTLLAVLTLYLFGGDGVHGFAFTMLLGVIVGTYSSVAIAAPILLLGSAGRSSKPQEAKPTAVSSTA